MLRRSPGAGADARVARCWGARPETASSSRIGTHPEVHGYRGLPHYAGQPSKRVDRTARRSVAALTARPVLAELPGVPVDAPRLLRTAPDRRVRDARRLRFADVQLLHTDAASHLKLAAGDLSGQPAGTPGSRIPRTTTRPPSRRSRTDARGAQGGPPRESAPRRGREPAARVREGGIWHIDCPSRVPDRGAGGCSSVGRPTTPRVENRRQPRSGVAVRRLLREGAVDLGSSNFPPRTMRGTNG
jgi:hypothetical protein